MRLSCSRAALAAIDAHALAGQPEEVCGVLVGCIRGAEREVLHAELVTNLRRDSPRDHFELDPGAIVAASLRARRAGLELVGFWHSHPEHPAQPSAQDSAGAWDDRSCLIVGLVAGRVAEHRSFRLVAGALREELLAVAPEPEG